MQTAGLRKRRARDGRRSEHAENSGPSSSPASSSAKKCPAAMRSLGSARPAALSAVVLRLKLGRGRELAVLAKLRPPRSFAEPELSCLVP